MTDCQDNHAEITDWRLSQSKVQDLIAIMNFLPANLDSGAAKESALRLIRHFVAIAGIDDSFGLEADEWTDQDLKNLVDFVIPAFRRYLKEQDKTPRCSLDQAFRLAPKRGQYPREDHTARDIKATAYVILQMRRGSSRLRAIGDAANLLFDKDTGDKAVEAAYSRYHDLLSRAPDEFLEALLSDEDGVFQADSAT